MANDYTPSTWAVAVLRRLGVTPSPGAVKALVGWAKAEGGHYNNSAKYNLLNTTQPEPGSQTFRSVGQGAADIRIYNSWDQGIDATVKTLENGRYGGIIAGLKKGDPGAVAHAIDASPWGTHGSYLYGAIGAAPSTVPRTTPVRPATGTTQAPAPVTPAVDNSGLRRSLVANFLNSGGVKSTQATQALATGWVNARDVPGIGAPAPGTSDMTTTATGTNVPAVKLRADQIDAQRLPYKWGGGHGGKVDPAKAIPLDCSGAVSAALGINPRVASQFQTFGKPGDGGSSGVTIYAKSTHVLMKVNGHFFGTSSTNPGGGAGWIPQAAISPEYLKGFTVRHL